MKVSWLTVKGKSMDEEHKCVVRHENNKGGVDQEILFPSINKGVIPTVPTEATYLLTTGNTPSPPPECSSAELNADELQLQYMNTSAYYTYLLLLLKSSVYLVVIMICLGRRGVCGHGKSS
nr:T cell receptor gamma constant 2 [Dasypus novemcinctus]